MTKEKNAERKRFFLREYLILALCIILQVANLLYWGNQKGGYYGDELYSYGFVSSVEYPSINEDRPGEKYLNHWHDSKYFWDYLTVSDEEAFDIKGVYRSIKQDVHPPLFYILLHISCSIFRNQFTKWAGLSLNLIFFVLSLLVLYKLGCEIFSSLARFLPMILYGFSVGAVGTAIMVRMYMMLTFAVLLFCYFHVRLWKNLENEKGTEIYPIYLGIFVSTVIGFLTQYYFVIFAFFVCLIIWGYQIIQKKYRMVVEYAFVMGSGLAVSFLLWPAMYQQIFEGYRGKEAFESIGSSKESFVGSLFTFLKMISDELFGGLALGVVAVFLILAFLEIKNRTKGEGDSQRPESRVLFWVWADFAVAVVMDVVILAKITPYKSVRYIYNIFPVVVLCAVMAMMFLLERAPWKKALSIFCMAGMFCLIPLSYQKNGVDYLYKNTPQKLEISNQNAEFPSVLLTHKNRRKTSNYESMFFLRRQKVYPIDESGIKGLSKALDEAGGKTFILHIDRCYKEDVGAMLKKVKKETKAESSDWLFNTSKCSVYRINR